MINQLLIIGLILYGVGATVGWIKSLLQYRRLYGTYLWFRDLCQLMDHNDRSLNFIRKHTKDSTL